TPTRAFVRDLIAGVDSRIAPSANAALSAPVLSGANRFAAFSSGATNVAPGDSNQSSEAFVADVPGGPTERIAPTATVTLSNGMALVPENTQITIGATAAPS